jgi:hypothetical protein
MGVQQPQQQQQQQQQLLLLLLLLYGSWPVTCGFVAGASQQPSQTPLAHKPVGLWLTL